MAAVALSPVRDFAKVILLPFIDERLKRHPGRPEAEEFFRIGRAHLAIVHDRCEAFLRLISAEDMGPFFRCVFNALQRSPVRLTQRFFCTLQIIHAYGSFLRAESEKLPWMLLVTEGACDMYGQSMELFTMLRDEELEWQAGEPASGNEERALRFSLCALVDISRQTRCTPPHPSVGIAVIRVMDELVGGLIQELDTRGVLNVGEWLIENAWNTPGRP